MRKTALLLASALLFTAGNLHANNPDQVHLHLDPATTEIHFTLKDTIHTVHGAFRLKSGDLVIDTRNGVAEGTINVETSSGASGNDSRDGKMKRDYLQAPSFPVATFQAQKVANFNPGAESQNISVSGIFTLHGGSHPMTLDFVVTRSGTQITAVTHFPIPYVAWGIKDPSVTFIKVEKEVAMDIIAKGTLTPEK